MLILKILWILLLILLILLLFILLIPFSYKLRGVSREKKTVWADLHWLFGLLGITGTYELGTGFTGKVRIFGIPIRMSAEDLSKMGKSKVKKEKEQEEKKKKKKKKNNRIKVFTLEGLQYVLHSVNTVLRQVLPRRFEGYGILGFDDPYYTGILSAVLESLRGIGAHNMKLEYAFDREVFEGELYLEGRIIIIVLLYIALRVLLHKSSRNMLLGVRRRSYGI